MLTIIVTILHAIMCFILVAIVLLQTGKGASMGAAFGGASNTLFGGAGPASFLNKITTIAAIVFMITSFGLAVLSSRNVSSSKVLDAVPTQQEQPAEQPAPLPEGASSTEETSVEESPATEDTQSEDPASTSENN